MFCIAGCIRNTAVGTGWIAKQNKISYSKSIQKFLKNGEKKYERVKMKKYKKKRGKDSKKPERQEEGEMYGFVFGN